MSEALQPEPDVFFLPWSVLGPESFGELDPGLLARRLPHLLQLMLNAGRAGPTAMLEVQSPPGEGPSRWVTLEEPVEPSEVMALVPAGEPVRALITGVMSRAEDELEVEVTVHFPDDEFRRVVLQATLVLAEPVSALRALARRVGDAIDESWRRPDATVLTARGDAFFRFLEGLEGAALIASDLPERGGTDVEGLLQPLSEALTLDPDFGLALRTAHMAVANALEAGRLDTPGAKRVLDRCFDARPRDGEGCVAVAEHFAVLGDDARARAWLEHAAGMEPPPARALESLGVLLANAGETVTARDLWLRGIEADGHPDFFAHLTRLAFAESQLDEAWDKALRGLRRMHERLARSREWDEEGRGAGLLLRYLTEHLRDTTPPLELVEALLELRGEIHDAEDRADLAACLLAVGQREEARAEFTAALERSLDAEVKDRAVRGLLAVQVPDFEKRFAQAVDSITKGKELTPARSELEALIARQPGFWPGRFFVALAQRRAGDDDGALDTLAEVLRLRPGQPDALALMGELFAARGNFKRALEVVDEALLGDDDDARLLGARARYLHELGRREHAREAVERALEHLPRSRELRRLKREIG